MQHSLHDIPDARQPQGRRQPLAAMLTSMCVAMRCGDRGVTRLRLDQADPERWLGLVRPHGQIENRVHGVRVVTFDEDRSHGRCGSIPQVMAAVRTTVIGVMHWAGEMHIAAAYRRLAAQPWPA